MFDLPAPLLEWLDARLTALVPSAVSIAFWAAVTGILSLELYRVVSPQQRIERLKRDAQAAQRRLSVYDGELQGAWRLIGDLLSLSFRRVAAVLPATLVGAYPVVAVLIWTSNGYGHRFPAPGEAVPVEAPAPFEGRWLAEGSAETPRVQLRRTGDDLVLEVPLSAPVPVLHKRKWWNWLIANPAGYLPSDAPVDEIDIDLPRRQVIGAGPAWVRGWEAVFLPVLFIAALAWKSARQIH